MTRREEAVTRSGSTAVQPPGSDLAAQLELTFRLLGKRIYLAGPGHAKS